ncbi:Dip2/Utp12 Family [Carpediemonas membranifera]|uniref:Dip2/Utp12 Family n=1 Tax=Carpediemonas membranifera TaxID=201153 RepID=A0A8J6E6W6_9EUKA|nr:Dip2/Utp12 Family [Carpediemonas membranifera]|eukprot:KAG9397582.1 Dip2/Utp12 Family [Carpediemonas membranifera]
MKATDGISVDVSTMWRCVIGLGDRLQLCERDLSEHSSVFNAEELYAFKTPIVQTALRCIGQNATTSSTAGKKRKATTSTTFTEPIATVIVGVEPSTETRHNTAYIVRKGAEIAQPLAVTAKVNAVAIGDNHVAVHHGSGQKGQLDLFPLPAAFTESPLEPIHTVSRVDAPGSMLVTELGLFTTSKRNSAVTLHTVDGAAHVLSKVRGTLVDVVQFDGAPVIAAQQANALQLFKLDPATPSTVTPVGSLSYTLGVGAQSDIKHLALAPTATILYVAAATTTAVQIGKVTKATRGRGRKKAVEAEYTTAMVTPTPITADCPVIGLTHRSGSRVVVTLGSAANTGAAVIDASKPDSAALQSVLVEPTTQVETGAARKVQAGMADAVLPGMSRSTLAERLAAVQSNIEGTEDIGLHELLHQALTNKDQTNRDLILQNCQPRFIRSTVAGLTPQDAVEFIRQLISLLDEQPRRAPLLVPWISGVLICHAAALSGHQAVADVVGPLYAIIEQRTQHADSFARLAGRLELITSRMSIGDAVDETPMALIQDDSDSDEESDAEDGATENSEGDLDDVDLDDLE